MSIHYRLTELAERDLLAIAGYLNQEGFYLVERFLERFEETTATLAAMPNIGKACPFQHSSLKALRRWHIKQFESYIIFYLVIESATTPIEIMRIVHGARDLPAIFDEQTET